METLIGDVPDDWQHTVLGEVCGILAGPSGAGLSRQVRTSSGVPLVTPKDIKDNRIVSADIGSVEPDVADRLPRYRLAPGDIVCVRTGELGRYAPANEKHIDWLFGTACLRLRPRGSTDTGYLTYYLGHPAAQSWIRRNASGSAIPSVSTRTLGSLPVVLPPPVVQFAIGEILGALDEKVAIHDQISRVTGELRDSLLPLLITGSIRPDLRHVAPG